MIVRAVMVPLTYRQLKSMQEMQRIAPQLQALKEKYKEDKQRQQQEMMKLYQEHGVNPFASCLPLLLQLPVFISLFYMLRSDLKLDICGKQLEQHFHVFTLWAAAENPGEGAGGETGCNQVAPGSAKFLFIPDITAKATGIVLIVLILMYVGSQISSTLVATATADPNQRRLVLLLPLVFVAILYRYPAGLLVYWITSNTWTIGQQLLIRRHMGATPAPPGGAPGSDVASPNGKADAPRGKPAPQPALAGVGSGGGTASTPAAAAAQEEEKVREEAMSGDQANELELTDDELQPAEMLEELLEEIVDGLGLDAEIEVEEGEGVLAGRVVGDDVGLFIGRRGQTIDAVQHLAQRIVFPEGPSAVRVAIDADGYRERRAEGLRAEADEAAEQALRSGRAVELDPMPASERRIVHEHLRDHPGVETHSEGDEPDRYLIVTPRGA